jgi:hypothetical protein
MDAITDQFDHVSVEDLNTLDLEIDVMFQKKHFTSLHLEEPKAKQIERAELELNVANPTAWNFRRYQMAMIAQVAKVPMDVVGELTNTQLRAAWSFLRARLEPDTPEIGEN